MKLMLNERLKHRIIGVVVIVAIAVIFLPAVMKKSNYRFDDNVSLSVHLPKKPALPNVVVKDEKAMFTTVKIVHVAIPTADVAAPLVQTVKARVIGEILPLDKNPGLTKAELLVAPVLKQAAKLNKRDVVAKKIAVQRQRPALKKDVYAVQLASFSQEKNANSLVKSLRTNGYKASYAKISNKNGELYKVIVGALKQKIQAQNLQQQLSAKLQLNGFIIKTRVS